MKCEPDCTCGKHIGSGIYYHRPCEDGCTCWRHTQLGTPHTEETKKLLSQLQREHSIREGTYWTPGTTAYLNGLTIIQVGRFLDKVVVPSDIDACWIYSGSNAVNLYGKTYGVTHVMWFLAYGVWPTLPLLHNCDNPPCVNLRHLREGTNKENSLDMVLRNRNSNVTKITEQDVRMIRLRRGQGELLKILAAEYGLTTQNIGHIAHHRTWKHVE